ncbi:MAG: hypothetical protein CR967_01330 [Proteobacteria bacterium]|nr:MAG: hypothetical protein CR967_01330 [Pseudomonadota bacterium]
MKKLVLLSLAASSLLFAGGSIDSIDLKDYKVVEGTYSKAYLNGGLTIEGGNQDQTSYTGYLGANTNSLYTSKSYSWSLNGLARADFSRGDKKGDSTKKSYGAKLGTTFDKYLFDDDTFFGYGSADLGYRKLAMSDDADDPYFKIGAGVGYGRMYDATPLAKSLRILEDLVKYNIVKANLAQGVAFALAKVVDIEDEYESKYGSVDYKAYWYEAMEKVLQENGALINGSLGAFGVARITEVLDIEKVAQRLHGWKVRGGFGKIISNYDGESEDVTIDLGFDYGLPLGLNTQIINSASISKVLNDSDLEFTFSNTLTHTYEFSDRIDWENSWKLDFAKYDEADDVTTNTLSSTFTYYLANQLSYDLTLSAGKTTGMDDWDTKLYTGITYRLK